MIIAKSAASPRVTGEVAAYDAGEFAQIGIEQWFRYATGILEVSAAVGILIPNFRFGGAVLMATIMMGATDQPTILHLPGLAVPTIRLMALSLALTWQMATWWLACHSLKDAKTYGRWIPQTRGVSSVRC
jgi:hypothetical protein